MDLDGLFTRTAALASGITDGQLRRARIRGELIAIRPGAYVSSNYFGTLDSEQQHLLFARSAPDRPILSHVSAAIAWGMDVWGLPLARMHVTTGIAFQAKTTRRRTVHGTSLQPHEYTEHEGVLLTTPARTVVDIARSTDFERAVCVGDSALRRGLVTMSELNEALESARYRAGVPGAALAVAAMTDRSDSVGESRSRLILNGAGLLPLLNQSVFDENGAFLARTDFLHDDVGVVDEFDGEGKYGESAVSARQTVLDEKHREDRVRECGWIFARWGWRDLSTPAVVIARVKKALEVSAKTPRPTGSFRQDPLP